MPGYAFQTQLFFLFQRERQVRGIAQSSMFGQGVVSDFMFAKDAIFAKLTLSDEEYRLYAQMHAPIAAQLREPDLVIWLQARPETLLARLRRRGIAMEQQIELDYLERLADAYVEHFDSYAGAPVFAIDAEAFNPIARDADLDGADRRPRPLRRPARQPGLGPPGIARLSVPPARRSRRLRRRDDAIDAHRDVGRHRWPPAPIRRRGRRRSASPVPTC